MAYSVAPLPGDCGFGAVISGLRLADIDDPEVRRELRRIWIDKGLVVFRDVDTSSEMHLGLSRIFGTLDAHPLKSAYADASDEITPIVYSPADSTVYEIAGEERGGWLPWHSDLAYVDRINRGGILKPVQLPEEGGQTGFIDQIEVYAALPDRLKSRIEGLHVLYQLDLDATHQRFGRTEDPTLLRMSAGAIAVTATAADRPRALHPLVYRQAETGREVLNLSPWFAVGIKEMPGAEGDELLAELAEFSIQPRFAYWHEWQGLDEMLLWDNWRMLHCAAGVPAHLTRRMERTTIAGDYALGRWEDPNAVVDGPVIMV